jgi:glycosyltransferase involved in cell wall biosynthesis
VSEPALSEWPVRVVFLLPSFDVGGAEGVVAKTVAGLDRRRYEPIVVAFARGSGHIATEVQRAGARALDLGLQSRLSPAPLLGLLNLMRDLRPQIVVTMMFHAGLAGRVIGRLAGVPIIVSSERVVDWESRARRLLNRATVWMCDAVTTNSRAGVEFWSRILARSPSDVQLVYNGVDIRTFAPGPARDQTPVVIGNLGRLHRKNGHVHLLHALRELRNLTDVPWRCVIAGDGDQRSILLRLREKLGLADEVQFLGHVYDAAGFLKGIDVYVQPSVAEGMSNAVLEAMASGLPVVATAVGGTPEAVVQEQTGLLVSPADSPALAAALCRLVCDASARRELGAAGRARVLEMFSVERMIADTEALFERLLRQRAARGSADGNGLQGVG